MSTQEIINIKSQLQRYGPAGLVGGTVLLLFTHGTINIGEELVRTYDTWIVTVLTVGATVVSLLSGGAVAVIFGSKDSSLGSVQGAWAGGIAGLLLVVYVSIQELTAHGFTLQIAGLETVVQIALTLVGAAAIPIALSPLGMVGGYIGYRIRYKRDSP